MKKYHPSTLKRISLGALTLALASLVSLTTWAQAPKKLLLVTVTKGFRHSSIPTAEKVLTQIGEKSGVFTLDYVRQSDGDREMVENMTMAKLQKYDGVIFANTTGILPLPDKSGFLDWIESGKAFIGMHSACDTFHGKNEVDPYIEMLGGEFRTHYAQAGVECLVQDPSHPATRDLGQSYCIEREEIYLIKNYDPTKVHELLVLDKHPNNKSLFGRFPVAWCKNHGDGNVFYTSLGHREDVWENASYQKHILGGIKWALGLEEGSSEPQREVPERRTRPGRGNVQRN